MCKALLMIILLGLAALAVACQGEGGPEPSPTAPPAASPEVTSPPATEGATAEATTAQGTETPPTAEDSPSPEPVACAAGSTDEFQGAQAESDFAMYCPTFLPPGLALQELAFYPIGATPPMDAPQPGELNASFVSSDFQTQVVLYEGHLGASFVGSLIKLAGEEGVSPEQVSYGDLEGTLYAPLTTITNVGLGAFVVVRVAGDITHVLHTAEVDVATVRAIAESMRPVSP